MNGRKDQERGQGIESPQLTVHSQQSANAGHGGRGPNRRGVARSREEVQEGERLSRTEGAGWETVPRFRDALDFAGAGGPPTAGADRREPPFQLDLGHAPASPLIVARRAMRHS